MFFGFSSIAANCNYSVNNIITIVIKNSVNGEINVPMKLLCKHPNITGAQGKNMETIYIQELFISGSTILKFLVEKNQPLLCRVVGFAL